MSRGWCYHWGARDTPPMPPTTSPAGRHQVRALVPIACTLADPPYRPNFLKRLSLRLQLGI